MLLDLARISCARCKLPEAGLRIRHARLLKKPTNAFALNHAPVLHAMASIALTPAPHLPVSQHAPVFFSTIPSNTQ